VKAKQATCVSTITFSGAWLIKTLMTLLLSLALSFLLGSALAVLTACSAPWPEGEVGDEAPWRLTFDPEASLDAVGPVSHLHLTVVGAPLELDDVHLVRGDLSPYTLSKLARGEPSSTLRERAVEHVAWRNADGQLILAPAHALEPDEVYTVASASPQWAQSFAVMANDPLPTLALEWPPSEKAETANIAVWCAEHALTPLGHAWAVHPSLAATLAPGSGPSGLGPNCIHLRPHAPSEPSTPPLLVDDTGRAIARLTPRTRKADTEPLPHEPIQCTPTEQELGPGCARVMDDRAIVRGPSFPLLWTLQFGKQTHRFPQPGEEPFVLPGLHPSAPNVLSLATQDAAGREQSEVAILQTGPPRAHVVITEVLANPLGPEPAQEWVELYNDGTVATQLGGWLLRDVGGEAQLPDAVLAPGAFALIVGDDYDPSGKHDPAPAAHTLLLRVPRVGKNGLSNAGEALELVDTHDDKVSAFTGGIEPKAGRSVIRIWPAAPDEDPASFTLGEGDPTPGAFP
jgi:hypothetical protein